MFMDNEHTFALFREPGPAGGLERNYPASSDGSGNAAFGRIRGALGELRQARIGPLSREEAKHLAGMLSQIQSLATSLLCDVTRRVADTDSDADPAEVLRRSARLPGRESKKMAKIARHLPDMPKVREKFSNGDITPTHVNALANAAEKVGPETVEADQTLLEAADEMSPDSFDRHTRKWSERKLIEAGLDPLERQRRAREAKLWVEKETGLGVVMAKFPRPQFEQLRQAIDSHYLHLLRQDGADGRDPDEVRTPKQRLTDVLVELLTSRDALTGEFITESIGIKAKASTQVVLTAPVGVLDGTKPDGHVEMIGVGQSRTPRGSPDSHSGHRVGRDDLRPGRPPTLVGPQPAARKRRPTTGRGHSLGGGCFECGAPMHRCELHHIQEWHRDRGSTDIDNLVAVCRRHHRWLETNNLIVRRTPNGYRTQPRAGPNPPG